MPFTEVRNTGKGPSMEIKVMNWLYTAETPLRPLSTGIKEAIVYTELVARSEV